MAADLLEIEPIKGVTFIQGDIREDKTIEAISEAMDFEKAHVVVSDAVPDFMGDRYIDHMRAVRLNEEIIKFCYKTLLPGGNLLMKIIRGPNEKELSEFAL